MFTQDKDPWTNHISQSHAIVTQISEQHALSEKVIFQKHRTILKELCIYQITAHSVV